MSDESEPIWINRPNGKQADYPYEAPPAAANPKVGGLPLYYAASLVAHSGLLQQILWKNAGFDCLRYRHELHDVEPRYEPTVIKTALGQTPRGEASSSSAFDPADLLNEPWDAKKSGSIYPSVLDYHEAFKAGHITPSAVVDALYALIKPEDRGATNHSIAFLQCREDLAKKAAAESTQRYTAGKPLSPLDGVPVAVKDEEDITGYRKTFGSKLDFTSKTDSTSYCVELWQKAGAVIIGKTNMHEIGMDTTNNNPYFGTPLNPHNDNYYTGGSSGGSAYVVAAGLTPIAIGNDGGGSIRIPSSYCGLYGLKPSHSRVSVHPTANGCKSTGVAGPMAANMLDLEIAYRIMAQPNPADNDSQHFIPPTKPINPLDTPKRLLGIFQPWFDRADPVVHSACTNVLTYLATHFGYKTVPITLPLLHDGQLAHAMTILAEAASDIPSMQSLSPANKILIGVGRQTSSIDLMQALKVRNLHMQHLAALFTSHPGLIIVTPTTPNAGWSFSPGDLKHGVTDANMQIRNMEYVWMANFTGCPAITAPVGYAKPLKGEGRVPMGLMGMGEWCDEDGLLAFGYDCEKALAEGVEGGRARPGNFVDVLRQGSGGV